MVSPRKKLQIFGITAVAILALAAVVFGAVLFTNNQSHADTVAACVAIGSDRKVVIKNNTMTPDHVSAPRCDKLTITNNDDINRLIAFGPHEHHVAYDGVTERLLTPGQSLTVTLNQLGNFEFHDHLHDEVQGTFTVIKQ
jgi:hypothetical protein